MYNYRIAFFACFILSACGQLQAPNPFLPIAPSKPPAYDHIVIIVEENKDYEQIIDQSATAPYINLLKTEGVSLTRMYSEQHPSQGNYFWLFSGSNQGIYDDKIRTHKFNTSNLAQQLNNINKTFGGYSESLPDKGSTVEEDGNYHRKHVPWISFSNIQIDSLPGTVNLRFKDFPTDFSNLPTVSFVIPDLSNDMHNGSAAKSIVKGDTWLRTNIDNYYQWAKTHNSLLIVTFDENDDFFPRDLTDPNDRITKKMANRIATVIAGAHVKPNFEEQHPVTHVNILRTIEAMYGLKHSGAQQKNALAAGITDEFIITDIFEK